eukprot:1137228-Pelagomonas_calceolata.AAC.5
MKEKETHWLRRAVSPLHHEATNFETENANGNLEEYWKHPAPEPGGEKMGMKLASKFQGTLLVKSQLFKLFQGILSVAGPTNNQKDGVKSHCFSINKLSVTGPTDTQEDDTERDSFSAYILAQICMLPLCRLQLLPRPSIIAIVFYRVYVPLVQT